MIKKKILKVRTALTTVKIVEESHTEPDSDIVNQPLNHDGTLEVEEVEEDREYTPPEGNGEYISIEEYISNNDIIDDRHLSEIPEGTPLRRGMTAYYESLAGRYVKEILVKSIESGVIIAYPTLISIDDRYAEVEV